jgi:hypothetical protein
MLFDIHSLAPWENGPLYPPVLKDQQKEPSMIARLSTLVTRIAELRQAALRCATVSKSFIFGGFASSAVRKKPAYECSLLAYPSQYLAEGEILTLPFNYCTNPNSDLTGFLV